MHSILGIVVHRRRENADCKEVLLSFCRYFIRVLEGGTISYHVIVKRRFADWLKRKRGNKPGVGTLTSGALLVWAGLFGCCRHIMAARGAERACGRDGRMAGSERSLEQVQSEAEEGVGATRGGSEVTARHFRSLFFGWGCLDASRPPLSAAVPVRGRRYCSPPRSCACWKGGRQLRGFWSLLRE